MAIFAAQKIINLKKTDPSKARVRVDNSGSRTSGFVKSTSTLSYDNFFNILVDSLCTSIIYISIRY